jgi:hypothetical protein
MSPPLVTHDVKEQGQPRRVSRRGGSFEPTHGDQDTNEGAEVGRFWSKKEFDLGCPLDLAQIESRHEVALPSKLV